MCAQSLRICGWRDRVTAGWARWKARPHSTCPRSIQLSALGHASACIGRPIRSAYRSGRHRSSSNCVSESNIKAPLERMGAPSVMTDEQLRAAYRGKRVFLTGHTGFKGGWLALWLSELGAEVTGYALAPDTRPSFFAVAGVEARCRHLEADVRDAGALQRALRQARPDHVFHLAAQSLVRRSYQLPLETIQTNVLGTANLLEAVRQEGLRCAVVVVTSDKCYEPRESASGHLEEDPMGGHDPYSMSKGAAELVVASYRRSFFPPTELRRHGVGLASARAGNVLGGGDWAVDRLVPDVVRALGEGRPVPVRNPRSVRPWQHVLEPLSGYLQLGARLGGIDTRQPERFCEAWNFGPRPDATVSVSELVERAIHHWGAGTWEDRSDPAAPHEARWLSLSIEKAQQVLEWSPRWSLDQAIQATVSWYRDAAALDRAGVAALTLGQIRRYLGAEA